MRPLVGYAEAKRLDAYTAERYGLGEDILMEAAAVGMAGAIEADDELRQAMDSSASAAAAVCGGGNNGGDALAVLRRLAFSGRPGLVAVVPGSLGPAASRRLAEAERSGVTILAIDDPRARAAIREAGLVIDGAAGIGFSGPARPGLAALIALAAEARGPVVAVDVLSGVGPYRAPPPPSEPLGAGEPLAAREPSCSVTATATLCVEPLKAELYYHGNRPRAGRVIPVRGVFHRSAGSGSPMSLLEVQDLDGALPPLDPDCHKGDRGALCVLGGGPGSVGAAALCARSGSAAGAGSVTLLVEDASVPVLSALLVSQMVRPASSPGSRRFSAAVAGPGWGLDEANARALGELWNAALPLALDADALRLLALGPRERRCSPLVLTPHPGEFAPLAAIASGADPGRPEPFAEAVAAAALRTRYDTAAVIAEVAAFYGAVVALKGSVTWIADPDGRLAAWDGRDPTLATAGSGDVLAGLLGGFLARGLTAWDASVSAVIAHGLAGRAAAAERGFYEAQDLIGHAARAAYARRDRGNQG